MYRNAMLSVQQILKSYKASKIIKGETASVGHGSTNYLDRDHLAKQDQ